MEAAKKKQVRYECVEGYIIADEGAYQVGDYVDDSIKEVQYITAEEED